MTEEYTETRSITQEEADQCASEQIQIIGSIQPHGFQLIVDPKTFQIVQHSDNVSTLLQQTGAIKINDHALLGSDLYQWVSFDEADWHTKLSHKQANTMPLGHQGAINNEQWECFAHVTDGWISLEFSPACDEHQDIESLTAQLNDLVDLLKSVHDEEELFQKITHQVQAYTQYDRVMMYRYRPDWSGEVVAESVSEGEQVTFLGLRFPAEDIPKQARELYKINTLRFFSNVDAAPARLTPSILPNGKPLDQSFSLLRSMSEMHRVYLKNMGVKATLSLSIMEGDNLWGMVVFHHNTPKIPSHRMTDQLRITGRLVNEIISSYLTPAFNITELTYLMSTQAHIESVFQQAKQLDISHSLIESSMQKINKVTQYDFIGVAYNNQCYVLIDDQLHLFDQRTYQAVAGIFDHQDTATFESHKLHQDIGVLPGLEDMTGIAITCTQSPIDFYVFIGRREAIKSIKWSGAPNTIDVVTENGKRKIQPRSSFALWREKVKGQSNEWQSKDAKVLKCLFHESKELMRLKHSQLLMNKLEKGAYYDALTGLANRAYLKSHVENIVRQKHITCAAFFFIDIDNFKDVNDFMGHDSGDKLLISISQRLNACADSNDLVVRLSGDEFIILFSLTNKPTIDDIEDLAHKVLSRVCEPVLDNDHTLVVTSSIGVVIEDIENLSFYGSLKRADIAMYAAKNEGKNRFHIFNEKDQNSFNKRNALTSDLRVHTASGDMTLYYQPKMDSNKQLKGIEALARWEHPVYGFIEPELFITLAEKNNLMYGLGLNILEKACADLAHWHSINKNIILGGPLSINISPMQLAERAFARDLLHILERHQIAKQWIRLEITESIFTKNDSTALQTLKSLQSQGISISLDNFGTGYSSLNSLWKLPIDEIKIDKSFISKMSQDDNLFTIVESVISLSKKLNLEVVGEGVENKVEFNLLKGLGCDTIQGFFYYKALDPITFQKEFIEN